MREQVAYGIAVLMFGVAATWWWISVRRARRKARGRLRIDLISNKDR